MGSEAMPASLSSVAGSGGGSGSALDSSCAGILCHSSCNDLAAHSHLPRQFSDDDGDRKAPSSTVDMQEAPSSAGNLVHSTGSVQRVTPESELPQQTVLGRGQVLHTDGMDTTAAGEGDEKKGGEDTPEVGRCRACNADAAQLYTKLQLCFHNTEELESVRAHTCTQACHAKVIRLQGCHVTPATIAGILTLIKRCALLVYFVMQDCMKDAPGFAAIMKALAACRLQGLFFDDTSLDDDNCTALAQLLAAAPSIQVCSLPVCRDIGPRGWTSLLDTCLNSKHANLEVLRRSRWRVPFKVLRTRFPRPVTDTVLAAYFAQELARSKAAPEWAVLPTPVVVMGNMYPATGHQELHAALAFSPSASSQDGVQFGSMSCKHAGHAPVLWTCFINGKVGADIWWRTPLCRPAMATHVVVCEADLATVHAHLHNIHRLAANPRVLLVTHAVAVAAAGAPQDTTRSAAIAATAMTKFQRLKAEHVFFTTQTELRSAVTAFVAKDPALQKPWPTSYKPMWQNLTAALDAAPAASILSHEEAWRSRPKGMSEEAARAGIAMLHNMGLLVDGSTATGLGTLQTHVGAKTGRLSHAVRSCQYAGPVDGDVFDSKADDADCGKNDCGSKQRDGEDSKHDDERVRTPESTGAGLGAGAVCMELPTSARTACCDLRSNVVAQRLVVDAYAELAREGAAQRWQLSPTRLRDRWRKLVPSTCQDLVLQVLADNYVVTGDMEYGIRLPHYVPYGDGHDDDDDDKHDEDLQDKEKKEKAAELASSTKHTILDLSNNPGVNDDGFAMLASRPDLLRHVETLDVSCTNAGSSEFDGTAQLIASCPRLQHVGLAGLPRFTTAGCLRLNMALTQCKHLSSIDITSNSRLDSKDCELLLKGLERCRVVVVVGEP